MGPVNREENKSILKNAVFQGLGQVLSKMFDGCLLRAKRSIKIASTKHSFIYKINLFFQKKEYGEKKDLIFDLELYFYTSRYLNNFSNGSSSIRGSFCSL